MDVIYVDEQTDEPIMIDEQYYKPAEPKIQKQQQQHIDMLKAIERMKPVRTHSQNRSYVDISKIVKRYRLG